MDGQKFCLKWDGFQSNVTSLFDELRRDDELTDVLLCCGEGSQLPAHRMMLSACSPYFRELLKNNRCQQMIIFLKDTSLLDLNAIIEFIYKGSVNVAQSQLASFIKTAEMLQIRGLSGDEEKVPPPTPTPPVTRPPQPPPPEPRPPPPPPAPPQTPPAKRFRSAEAEAIAQNARAILAGGLHHLGTPGRKVARIPVQPHQQLQSMTSQLPASPAVLSGSSDHSAASPPAAVKEGREAEDGGAGEEEGEKLEQKYGVEAAQNIKVETLDLTDDDVSLDSTLERVNNFEGGFQAEDTGNQGGDANVAGPSHLSEDGAAQPARPRRCIHHVIHQCHICEKIFLSAGSLNNHRAQHRGLTACPVCGRVYSIISSLRKHMKNIHKMSPEEVKAKMQQPRGQQNQVDEASKRFPEQEQDQERQKEKEEEEEEDEKDQIFVGEARLKIKEENVDDPSEEW